MLDLLFFMILGHYCGDFAFQTDRMAREKGNSYGVLTAHVFLYTAVLAFFIAVGMFYNGHNSFFSLTTLLVLLAIFTVHWIQDHIKARWFNGSKQAYYFDQAVHIVILYAVRMFAFNG